MLLSLDTDKPWDATYTNELRRSIYRCEASTSFTLGDRDFTLYRDVPPDGHPECVGKVVFDKWINRNSRIVVDAGNTPRNSGGISAGEMFTSTGSIWVGHGRAKTFTGPDGRDYTWTFARKSCSLFYASGISQSSYAHPPLVAKFKRSSLGLFSSAHPAQIEVTEGYEGMLDMILLTLIYVEKVKRDKQQRRTITNRPAAIV